MVRFGLHKPTCTQQNSVLYLYVQSDRVTECNSTVACLITSFENFSNIARVEVQPDNLNGLERRSFIMADKIYSFEKSDMVKCIGALGEESIHKVKEKLKYLLELQ
jgi:mRNA-degrading endonuclease toxin of MazEF toxin-antitoxin module